MKLSVVLFVVLLASVCANDEEEAHKKETMRVYKKCMDKLKMTMEELHKLVQENKPNKKMDCLHGCLFVEQQIIKEDGSVNQAAVDQITKAIASQENGKAASEAFKKCVDVKK